MAKKIVKCRICQKDFEANHPLRCLCSNECRRLEQINRLRKSYNKFQQLNMKQCLNCKTETTTKFCSINCREVYYYKKNHVPKLKKEMTCLICGKVYATFSTRSKHCSRMCYKKSPEYRRYDNERVKKKRIRERESKFVRTKSNRNIKEVLRRRNRKYGEHTLKGISIDGFVDLELKRLAGQETDHIIPLHGKTVSGLNVPWNLQLLTREASIFKTNKFDGTYDNKSWIEEYRNKKVK